MLSEIQSNQEVEYWFPYHYVTKMPKHGFREHFVDTWGINYISTIELIIDQIVKWPEYSIIDVGCGDGRLARELKIAFPNRQICGVDYSSRAIDLARVMNQSVPDLHFFDCDITTTKLDHTSDVAILMEVFEHIPLDECDKFLKSVASLLTEGGQLLLTVPHSNKPVEYKHFQHFTVSSISEYLSRYFVVEEVVLFEKKGFRRRVVEKILCNGLFVLNHQHLLDGLYSYCKKRLFYCDSELDCQRIFVRATKMRSDI
jgi:2-polyprenyl-3-methyl-5-hydroxy-6-metoxy-1,4-benzoquinol methylase